MRNVAAALACLIVIFVGLTGSAVRGADHPALKFAKRDAARAQSLADAAAQKLLAATQLADGAQLAAELAVARKADAAEQAKQSAAIVQAATAAKQAADQAAAAAQAALKVSPNDALVKAAAASAGELVTATAKLLTEQAAIKAAADAAVPVTAKLAQDTAAAIKPLQAAKVAAEKTNQPFVAKAKLASMKLAAYTKTAPKADPKQIRLISTLSHGSPFLSVRIDPAGENLFAGAQDNSLQRWNLFDGSKTAAKGHASWVRRFDVNPDGKGLVTGSYDGSVSWWGTAGDKPLRTIKAHKGFVRGVAVSLDGKYLATGGNDLLIKIWSMADGKLVTELPGHKSHIFNIAFHPNGKHFISGDLKGALKQWEVGTWKHVRDLDASVLHKYDKTFKAFCGGIRGIDFSPDGKHLAVGGISEVTNAFAGVGKPTVVLFDWATGKRLQVMKPKKNFTGAVWGLQFHPSGKFIIGAGGGSGGSLWFWKLNEAASFHAFKLPQVGYDIAMHPDGLRFAVACYDKTVRVYDIGPKWEPAPKKKAVKKK